MTFQASGPSPLSAFMKYQLDDFRQPPPAHMGAIGQKPGKDGGHFGTIVYDNCSGRLTDIQRPMFPASHQFSAHPFWGYFNQMNSYPAQLPAYGPLRPFSFLGPLNAMSHLNSYSAHHHPSLSPSQPNGSSGSHSQSLLESVMANSDHQKSSPHSSSLSRMSNGTSSASSVGANSPLSSALSAGRSISSSGSESKSKLNLNGGLGNHHHHLNNLSNNNSTSNRLNHLNQSSGSNSSSGHLLNGSLTPNHHNNLRNIDDDSRSVSSNNSNNMSHVKKPLNAFMLYMKEQRPRVVNEYTLKESAAINQILGKQVPVYSNLLPSIPLSTILTNVLRPSTTHDYPFHQFSNLPFHSPPSHYNNHLITVLLLFQWHSLSREEQQKYYEMARKERQRHQQLYPGWTARDNYAIHQRKKKKKRDKSADGGTVLTAIACPPSRYSLSPSFPRFLSVSVVSFLPTQPAEGGSLKKCRARFGLDQQSKWCKPCRCVLTDH